MHNLPRPPLTIFWDDAFLQPEPKVLRRGDPFRKCPQSSDSLIKIDKYGLKNRKIKEKGGMDLINGMSPAKSISLDSNTFHIPFIYLTLDSLDMHIIIGMNKLL